MVDHFARPNSFAFPQKCSACLGAVELMHQVTSVGGEDGRSMTYSFDVPMCRRCRSRLQLRKATVGSVAAALVVAWIITAATVPDWPYLGWLGGGAGVGIVAFLAVAFGIFEPASYARGRLQFRNQDYQRLFEAANQPESGTPSQAEDSRSSA